MKLSTKARYGARAALDLALNYGPSPVPLRDIAERQEISERYLENIMSALVSAGLVGSTRGKNGGFMLSKPPRDIRLGDVVQVVEGSLAPVPCVDDPGQCGRSSLCVTKEIWKMLKDAIHGVLGSITLLDMVEMHRQKSSNQSGPMFYI